MPEENHPASTAAEDGAEGFTLLEVLIAVALTASVLVTLLILIRSQQETEIEIKERLEILSQTKYLLSQWLAAPELPEGTFTEPSDGGRTWRVRVSRVLLGGRLNTGSVSGRQLNKAAKLQRVEVCCFWSEEKRKKSFCLQSLKTSSQ